MSNIAPDSIYITCIACWFLLVDKVCAERIKGNFCNLLRKYYQWKNYYVSHIINNKEERTHTYYYYENKCN